MMLARFWVRLASVLVPAQERSDWTEEWLAELAANDGTMSHAWGALADAWYLRTEGWTMDAMWRDVRMAVRSLIRKPLFTVLAGVTLAVGIGANTAIFSVVDAVLINPLPFPEPERVVSYNHEAPGLGVNSCKNISAAADSAKSTGRCKRAWDELSPSRRFTKLGNVTHRLLNNSFKRLGCWPDCGTPVSLASTGWAASRAAAIFL